MQSPALFGFLNVYKPAGMTSHDVVSVLRRVTKIRQIGHTGTLDPFAEGVLPVCIGKSTRLIEYLNGDKEYLATVQFGKNTDTYDLDGTVTESFNKTVTEQEVKDCLKSFEGEILQIPPVYSALKVNGKKMYEYAREGKDVEIKPRKVFISNICLKEFDEASQSAKILVACSKGTYIRSVAYDLGKILGCGAYLSKLVRTKAGMFDIENSVMLSKFESLDFVVKNLINPLEMLDMPKIVIDDEDYKKVVYGQILHNKSQYISDFVILVYNNNVCAVASAEGDVIKLEKVFV